MHTLPPFHLTFSVTSLAHGEGLHSRRMDRLRSAAETICRRFSTAHRRRRDGRADSTVLGAASFRSKASSMLRDTLASTLLSMLLAGAASADVAPASALVRTAASRSGATSSGWVNFTTSTNMSILVPVTVNGQTAVAMLYGGPSTVDKDFAAAIALKGDETTAPIAGLEVQVGDLTLHNMSAGVRPVASPLYARITGRPMLVQMGEEVFRKFIVDIDFAHHRLAFRDPAHVVRPKGAVEVPLLQKGDAKETQWVIPLSLDKAPPAWFEVELGNVTGPLLVTRGYAETHGLFDGRPTSERQSGPFHERVVTLDHLDFAGMGFPHAPIAIVPDSQNPPEGITGGVGLPLLSHFHLIFDYPHHRLFAIPNTVANEAPMPKDRIGLYLAGLRGDLSGGLVVAFVSPRSPAEAGGLKAQDRVVKIDGKVLADWPPAALVALDMTAPGVTHAFTLAGGEVRTVTARDFF